MAFWYYNFSDLKRVHIELLEMEKVWKRKLFKTKPTLEVLDLAVRSLGLGGINDNYWVDKTNFKESLKQELFLAIEPFYYPCFRKIYLNKPEYTHKDHLTIVRQILKAHNKKLIHKEVTKTISHLTYIHILQYTLAPSLILCEPRVVEFLT